MDEKEKKYILVFMHGINSLDVLGFWVCSLILDCGRIPCLGLFLAFFTTLWMTQCPCYYIFRYKNALD
ncbi:Uncharacterized protein TCM_041576, partial [Theobroma cacao]